MFLQTREALPSHVLILPGFLLQQMNKAESQKPEEFVFYHLEEVKRRTFSSSPLFTV